MPTTSLRAAAPTSSYSATPSRPPTPPFGTAIPMYHRSQTMAAVPIIRGRLPGLKGNHGCRCPSSPGNLAANTTFRDRHPDIAPLTLEPRRRATQPPAAQAAQGEPPADHGRRTNIRGRRPGLKDNRCCRCHINPDDTHHLPQPQVPPAGHHSKNYAPKGEHDAKCHHRPIPKDLRFPQEWHERKASTISRRRLQEEKRRPEASSSSTTTISRSRAFARCSHALRPP